LGGLILATLGAEVAFGLNALSYGAVVVALLLISRRIEVGGDREVRSVTESMALGLRFARFTLPFRRVLLLAGLFAICSAVIQAVLPNRTTELGGAEWAYGLLLGSMGLGALIGAFTRPQIDARLGARAVPFSMTAFGVGGIVLGVAPSVPLAAVALA